MSGNGIYQCLEERHMRIGPFGIVELLIIVVIIALIFGPALFKKFGKRVKQTAESAKEGIEAGARENGKDLKLEEVDKDSIMDKVTAFQDKLDEKLTEAEREEEQAERVKAAAREDDK